MMKTSTVKLLRASANAFKLIWRRATVAIFFWLLSMIVAFYSAHIRADFINLLTTIVVGKGGPLRNLTILALILIVLWIADYLTNFIGEYSLQSLKPYTYRVLARQFVMKILRARRSSFLRSGDILARFVSDLDPLSEALGGLLTAFIIQLIRLIAGVIILYSLSPHLTMIALTTIPVYYIVFKYTSRKISRISDNERKCMSELVESVKISVDGIKLVKRASAQKFFENIVNRSLEDRFRLLLKLLFVRVFFGQTFNALYSLFTLILLIIGGYLVYLGYTTIGSVIAFSGAAYNIYEPITNMAYMFAHTATYIPYLDRYREVLLLEEERDEGRELKRVDSIICKSVRLVEDNVEVLKEIDFEIKRGEIVAIVGPTASGKTSLLLILSRIEEPSSGEVLVNGIDYRRFKASSVRRKIFYIPSKDFFFRASVLENLTLGLQTDKDNILKALKIAKADFVKDINVILDPEKLSDGEKQRLALARALILKPDVLLLDEALDAVDPTTEEYIIRNLRDLINSGRLGSAIIVTHRMSSLRYVDRVYVISDGRIVCSGRLDEILKKSPDLQGMILRFESDKR
ncbi:MAG: hypothetical protein DRZ82_01860 [Thermoprotei archaeon]|nr:MAG: hypothetical protein DRZ82_01860 [Thermoprotei archaeon]